MKKFFISIIAVLLFIFTQNSVFAKEDLKLPDQKIRPGAITYPVKRALEKFRESLPIGNKVSLYRELTLTRLAELDYIVSKKQLGDFQTSNERFSYYAGKLTETAASSGKETKDKIRADFDGYKNKLEQLKTTVEYGTSYWMLLQHSINSLTEYSDKLSK